MRRCFLYPGQGAQFVGMGKDLYDASEETRALFGHASDVAGFDLPRLVFEGTEEDIKSTDKSQVAITVVNLAARRALAAAGIVAEATAGFSLGEYSALVDAGVLTEEDAIRLVVARGRIMEAVSRGLDSPEGAPGMAAVLGIDVATIEKTLASAGLSDVYPANINSPVQTVLSGTAAGLDAATPLLKDAGARRVLPLKVSGPFHSPLMSDAKDRFSAELDRVTFADPVKAVYSNVTGARIASGDEAKRLCADQLVKPVRWVDEEALIAAESFDELLEVGPGEVLGGLWRAYQKSYPEITTECVPSGTVEHISAIASRMS